MRRSRTLVAIAAAAAVVTLVLACGVLALIPRGPGMLTPQEAAQRAVDLAQTEYAGVVADVAVDQETLQDMGGALCTPTQEVLASMYALARGHTWNDCDLNLRMWKVTLQGNFTMHGSAHMREVEMRLWPDGQIHSAGGEVIQP